MIHGQLILHYCKTNREGNVANYKVKEENKLSSESFLTQMHIIYCILQSLCTFSSTVEFLRLESTLVTSANSPSQKDKKVVFPKNRASFLRIFVANTFPVSGLVLKCLTLFHNF